MIEIRHPMTGALVARFGFDWQAVDPPRIVPPRPSEQQQEDRRARNGRVGNE